MEKEAIKRVSVCQFFFHLQDCNFSGVFKFDLGLLKQNLIFLQAECNPIAKEPTDIGKALKAVQHTITHYSVIQKYKVQTAEESTQCQVSPLIVRSYTIHQYCGISEILFEM